MLIILCVRVALHLCLCPCVCDRQTMTIYVIERLLRVYRASLPVSILSISLMDDVMSLEFAKEGFFETESYKEGQYLFLLSPPISRVQWSGHLLFLLCFCFRPSFFLLLLLIFFLSRASGCSSS